MLIVVTIAVSVACLNAAFALCLWHYLTAFARIIFCVPLVVLDIATVMLLVATISAAGQRIS